ncbi:hypothetical protein C488_06997 [Natrinema pellirubrum DSM 15624]|uniref:Uncharacterized protein n=1 Tax=Natrinema pellirubrum (strain DSM 15624 / CIP 106293 / JCM 10476 / NCIMB 786 / 157) TaxID=797303 RepID=L0JI19_NATP1|nr:hypothetical protein [Natrinema pellirubrum]AGB30488.1 hypothetical protein Natpe_0561 [Natrinema pellirubrum DSM 15624]ELY77256.1 hypothetical protein C488_06997 [Natrinema pellirubrum DSM 15624]
MTTDLDATTDFAELAARVRTQSQRAPDTDTDRVTVRSLEAVRADTLETLLEAAESEHLEPGALVVVCSRANADLCIDRESGIDDVGDLESVLGCGVRVEGELPDDTILVVHPDAVDGEDLLEPEAIACGIVGTDE